MSFLVFSACPDLSAQQEAPGQGVYGCAEIHPEVKQNLSPGSLPPAVLPSPGGNSGGESWQRRRMLRNRMLRVSIGAQSTEMEGGTPRATQSVVAVVYRTLAPGGKMARTQEVGRGLNNYVHSVLTSHGFTLGWSGKYRAMAVLSGYC